MQIFKIPLSKTTSHSTPKSVGSTPANESPGLAINHNNISASVIEKSTSNTDRLVKVTLNDRNDVKKIFRNIKNTPKNVRIFSDKTALERAVGEKYSSAVSKHNITYPDDQLRVKYRSGSLKIIDSRNKVIFPKPPEIDISGTYDSVNLRNIQPKSKNSRGRKGKNMK